MSNSHARTWNRHNMLFQCTTYHITITLELNYIWLAADPHVNSWYQINHKNTCWSQIRQTYVCRVIFKAGEHSLSKISGLALEILNSYTVMAISLHTEKYFTNIKINKYAARAGGWMQAYREIFLIFLSPPPPQVWNGHEAVLKGHQICQFTVRGMEVAHGEHSEFQYPWTAKPV